MYINGIRALVALLIALSASIGVQNTQTPSAPQSTPAILDSSVVATDVPLSTPSAIATESGISIKHSMEIPIPTASDTAALNQHSREEKVRVLHAYLTKHNSPMAENAQDFVDAAEQYNLDWRLVPSIAGVESTFGKRILPGSYNPFGWGGGYIKFESFRDSIYTVSKGISEKYVQDGLDTPHKMQKRYAPPSHTWGNKVQYFMNKIQAYSEENTENKQ